MIEPKQAKAGAVVDSAQAALEREISEWEGRELAAFLARQPERQARFRNNSGMEVVRVYTALDVVQTPPEDIGLPGRYPYTRGPYPTMYRGREWTMRQIAGFGTGSDTNQRFKYLISEGQTGLSTDFDMPTLMGYDSDHPRSLGEVGREGVAGWFFSGVGMKGSSMSIDGRRGEVRPCGERGVANKWEGISCRNRDALVGPDAP